MITVSPTETLDRSELVDRLRSQLPPVLGRYAVSLAYLYGSAATDSTTALSDVDIALVAGCSISIEEQLDLELSVQTDLSHELGIRRADVRLVDRAPLRLQGQVVTHGILLFARSDDDRIAFETATRDRYLDFQVFQANERVK